jgi:hypothetical protein
MDDNLLICIPIDGPLLFYYKSNSHYDRSDKAKAINRLFGIDESYNVRFVCNGASVKYEITQELKACIDVRVRDRSSLVKPITMLITDDFALEIFTLIAKHLPDVVPQLSQ